MLISTRAEHCSSWWNLGHVAKVNIVECQYLLNCFNIKGSTGFIYFLFLWNGKKLLEFWLQRISAIWWWECQYCSSRCLAFMVVFERVCRYVSVIWLKIVRMYFLELIDFYKEWWSIAHFSFLSYYLQSWFYWHARHL